MSPQPTVCPFCHFKGHRLLPPPDGQVEVCIRCETATIIESGAPRILRPDEVERLGTRVTEAQRKMEILRGLLELVAGRTPE